MTMLPTYFPSPPQGVWHLGPLPIRAYALFIITGIVIALVIGDRRWEARGGQRGVIYDVALWAVPFGLIGGRLYHLATDWRTYWGPGGAGLGAAVRIWDGGLGIWGAVALGVVGAWISCRRHGIPLPAFADAVAPGLVLAQAIGRLGNYFNQELYGRETTQPWGLEIFYRRDPSGYIDPHSLDGVSTGQLAVVVQPTFLYELIWNVLVFALLIYIDKRFKIGHGRLFATYVAAYCVGRFWVELLRDDTATHIAGIRINSFTSTFVFIGAVVYIMAAPKGREDPESLRGNDDLDEEEAEPEHEPAEELATVAAAAAGAGAAAPVIVEDAEKSADSGETPEVEEVVEPDAEAADEPDAEAADEPEAEAVTEEPKAEEPEAEEPEEAEETEDPAAEVDETEVEDAEAEEPEVEAVETEVVEAEPAEESEIDEADEADEADETDEPEVAEPDAAETEAEEPEAEVAEVEAEAEPEEPEVEEPVAEQPEAVADDADEAEAPEEPEAESESAEVQEPTETAQEPAEASPAAKPAVEEPPASVDGKGSRSRWPLRRRNRGSSR
jgi:prolipoprotein diacylglyceryl transferase